MRRHGICGHISHVPGTYGDDGIIFRRIARWIFLGLTRVDSSHHRLLFFISLLTLKLFTHHPPPIPFLSSLSLIYSSIHRVYIFINRIARTHSLSLTPCSVLYIGIPSYTSPCRYQLLLASKGVNVIGNIHFHFFPKLRCAPAQSRRISHFLWILSKLNYVIQIAKLTFLVVYPLQRNLQGARKEKTVEGGRRTSAISGNPAALGRGTWRKQIGRNT